MISFISKLFSYRALLLLFVVSSVFFAMPKFADASCEVDISDTVTRFRANGVVGIHMADNWYDDESGEEPFVYVDIKFTGCTPADSLFLTIFPVRGTFFPVKDYQIPVSSYVNEGGLTAVFRAEEGGCVNSWGGPGAPNECLLIGMLTDKPRQEEGVKIKALLGNIVPRINDTSATAFLSHFASSLLSLTPNCNPSLNYLHTRVVLGDGVVSCGNQNQDTLWFSSINTSSLPLFFATPSHDQKIIDYYNTHYPNMTGQGSWTLVTQELYQAGTPSNKIALPGFSFDCDGVCGNDPWILLDNNSPFIPYGTNHPLDTGYTPVGSLPSNYEDNYFPLAPLPFEGLNGGSTPTLGSYLVGLFNAGIIITILLTVIMIVFNGIKYMTVDAIGTKTESRANIWNAIMGLVIALGSWLLLNTVSPKLASNLSINLPQVTLAGDVESISVQGISGNGGYITGFSLPQNEGFFCEGSGGSNSVPDIIDSFLNKVTYRYGAKGGTLPTGQQFPSTPNETETGQQYMCTNNGSSVPCRSFCPENSTCLDCSGFVNHVRQCAGLSTYAGTSSMVNSSDAIAINMNTLSGNGKTLTVNGSPYTLQPGDILVWNGHVVIYYGDGKIAESKGDVSGFKHPNSNIKKTNLASSKYKKNITHLIKANP